MEIQIRKTSENDFSQTEHITREAFWNVYKPGCDEHLVLHNIRKSTCCIPGLDLIAVCDNEIIGHIVSTKAKVVDPSNIEHEVVCVGPLSVLPAFQKKGIGSMLMKHSIAAAREAGYAGMILFGSPEYYHRFGFRNAIEYGITTNDDKNFEPFMALELRSKGLDNVRGRFYYDRVYETLPDELDAFEKQFPYKEKLITDTQLGH